MPYSNNLESDAKENYSAFASSSAKELCGPRLSLVLRLAKVFLAMITRVADKERTTLTVSGRIDAEQLPDLRRFVEAEQENEVTLDLAEVSLVDADAVRFLLLCEEQGIWIVRCPAYVREWMVREKRSQ